MSLSIDTLKVGDGIDSQALYALQPRAYEGCFAWVNEKGSTDVYLIQDQMPFWLLEFFDQDLEIAFDVFNSIPVLSLRYRHFQVTMPMYNKAPTSDRLDFCILELSGLQVQKINTYTLPQRFYHALRQAIVLLEEKEKISVYAKFDALKGYEIQTVLFELGVSDRLKTHEKTAKG